MTRYALLRRGIFFLEQQQVGRYWPDFVLPEYWVIIEVDGEAVHGTERQRYKDRRKDRAYAGAGYRVFRFPERLVRSDADALVDALLRALVAEIDAIESAAVGAVGIEDESEHATQDTAGARTAAGA